MRRDSLRKYRHKTYLWGVYVAPGSRGAGVSKLLLSEAISFARKMPYVTQINLTVTAANATAIHLYRSSGFKEFGKELDSIFAEGTLHHELHMALRFTQF